MEEIKVIELFGGIGALTQALKRTGIPHKIVDYVEIDKYAVASYNAMNGTNYEPQDICTWDKDIEVDLIMHGSPCQSISLAGLQHGADKDSGTRSSLMWETVRIVEKLKPKYVIWENVKNLLSKKHRHNFDAYLEQMEQLGYTNYYQVLNAKDYGIPQNRERVFTVSILNGKEFEFPKGDINDNKIIEHNPTGKHQQDLIQDEEGLCRCIPAGTHGSTLHLLKTVVRNFKFPEGIGTIPLDYMEENPDSKYYLTEENMSNYQRNFGSKGKELDLCNPIPTITSSMGSGGGNVPYFVFPPKQKLKLKLKEMLENEVDEKYYLSEKAIKGRLKTTYQKYKLEENCINNKDIHPTILARFEGAPTLYKEEDDLEIGLYDHTSSDNFANGKRDYGYRNEYGTLKCTPKYSIYKSNDLRIRKLTPKECWRLMGFDDEVFEKASKVNSNTQLYKQAGNSIVVNVLEAILTNLLKDKTEKENR